MSVVEITPQAWCRRILAAMIERQAEGTDAGHLELLLVCLIELNPAPDAFELLLARYAEDQRAGIAEAAEVLQRAWRHATSRALEAEMPALRERLRVAGTLLDQAAARSGVVLVTPDRVRVQTVGSEAQHSLGLLELRHEIAGRQALRGLVAASNPLRPDRHETRLRAVGFRLEGIPPQDFELFATPRAVVVDGAVGYHHVFELDELAALLQLAVGRRRELSAAAR